MKLLDKKGRLFGLVNLIDLLVIALVIVVGIGAFWYLNRGKAEAANKTVIYTVEFRYKKADYAEKVTIGAPVADSVKGFHLGTAESVQTIPDYDIVYNEETGQFVKAEIPDQYRVLLTIRASGTENEREIRAEGQVIKVGGQMYIKGKGFASEGFCVGIETRD